jgi:phosphoribosyl-dephospho-CoA transferase
MALTARPRPHDLVRLTSGAVSLAGAPAWVRASLARAPWAVVRHDRPVPGQIPVGIRGPTRELRWATYITQAGVAGIRTPESLRHIDDWAAIPDVAAMCALHALIPSLNRGGTAWGPTGSAGFSLATGHIAVHQASDLDLLLRCPVRPACAWLDRMARLFTAHEARVDAQVDTPAGMAHLEDLRRGGPSLVRTCAGPVLCADPWEEAGA